MIHYGHVIEISFKFFLLFFQYVKSGNCGTNYNSESSKQDC
jgi:hypothetical protein